jgi:hypothetical protein
MGRTALATVAVAFGHSIIIVVLFLGYAAEDDDGWIHEVV